MTARALTPDRRALAGRYVPLARSLAGREARRLGVGGTEASECLLSDAYLSLCLAVLRSDDPTRGLGALIRATTRLDRRDARRRDARSREMAADPSALDRLPDPGDGGEDPRLDAAIDAARSLPVALQSVLWGLLGGRTMAELAREAGCHPTRIRRLYDRALRLLLREAY